MHIERRDFIVGLGASVFAISGTANAQTKGDRKMYGLIGKMTALAGKRDALITILLEGVSGMPGCLSYVIAKDTTDSNAIWITEVWDSQKSHKASLSMPSVQKAIAQGKPLIESFGERFVTDPVGGHGLKLSKPTR